MAKKAEETNMINQISTKLEEAMGSVHDIQDNLKASSQEIVQKGIGIAKKYPVHTALGVGAIGFVAGALFKKSKNS
jgi:ElaB/YqjD/DUF883 family membrane-anchored ribosome-binding protein